jgi:UDP-GlcNAc3NAcA epimerase
MIKLITIIGARPQIIKAAAFSRAIKNHYQNQIQEIIVHTGQHYDQNMSTVFFDELGIPQPHYNLNVGSASHGKQTALMIQGIEEILVKENPQGIVLYGDTNSTLAGAVAASKIHVPVIHIEAGLRSFNKAMPEEINRIMCDHVSTLLFSPTQTGFENLVNEGFKTDNAGPYHIDNPKIFHCGDVMYDNSLYFSELAENKTDILAQHHLTDGNFLLVTIHRNNNTDDKTRLTAIFSALNNISSRHNINMILPLHPRTAQLMEKNIDARVLESVKSNTKIKIIPPASFLEMIALEKNAKLILTDSGGVQKEAYFFKKPCVVLRSETEWVELVKNGNTIIADADEQKIIAAYESLIQKGELSYPPIFGDGKASEFICNEILALLKA